MKNIKKTLVVLILCSFIMGTIPVSVLAQQNSPEIQIFEYKELSLPSGVEYVPGEIIVQFKPGVSNRDIANINSKHGTSVKYTSPYAGFKILHVPKGKTVSEMVEIYSKNPNVEYTEPNYIGQALMVPNDPYYDPYQWHLDNAEYGGINMKSAWDISTGSNDVVVAVIDTGVAYENHQEFVDLPGRRDDYWRTYAQAPDLADTCFVAGYDFVNDDLHPNDDGGHGTHVTGTIAQNTNNGVGGAGIAFDACIMPVKVLGSDGIGTYTDIIDGIYFAADNGANVISMSLGGPSPSIALEDALAYAYDKGVTIVCSSGNDGSDTTISYPAAYDAYCIAVGATRYDEEVTYYSNGGSSLDLTAPGGQLYIEGTDTMLDQNRDGNWDGILQQTHDGSDYTKFGYYLYMGTSMAAPHVSGVATLLISKGIANTPDEVREALQSTAEDKGTPGLDSEYGWGIVDAHAALQWTAEPVERVLTTIAVSPNSATLNIEETQLFTATGKDQYGTTIETGTINWQSTNTTVGTIDLNGLFTASLVGTTTISATSGDVTGTASVIVKEAPILTTIEVSPTSATLIEGETQEFIATGKDQDGNTIDTGIITWTSTNDTVGTIDLNGVFTASLAGTTTISATSGDVEGTSTVTVNEASTNTMSVSKIEMWYSEAGPNNFIYTKVTVLDSGEVPVPEATVSLKMTLPDGSIAPGSGYTLSDGTVTFKLKSQQTGEYTSEVTAVTHDYLPWDVKPESYSIEVE